MSKMPFEFEEETEAIYDSLISLIENSQGQLAPIVVGCDEVRLRERVIERYEREAKDAKVQPYRVMLGMEPSLKTGLEQVVEREAYLQEGGDAVFTVLGANTLLWVKLRDEDAQSEVEKFFGYLQWTREALRSYRYPIVLWVSIRMLREMGRRAPDFWSWRKASFQFGTEDERLAEINREPIEASGDFTEDEPLPPLDELLQELEELKVRSPDSPNLPMLYSKIGKVYDQQIERGESRHLEADRSAAIDYFEKAIEGMKAIDNQSAQIEMFRDLGNFLDSQSQFIDSIQAHQHSLTMAEKLDDTKGIAQAFCNLGNAYTSLGDYQESIDFYSQSLEIARSIGNKNSIASSLNGLGNAYAFLGDYQKSVECHAQSLKIEQSIGNKRGIAASIGNLGIAYNSLGDYQKSVECHAQSLKIEQSIGNKRGIAASLCNLGIAYAYLGDYQESIDFYSQSLEIARSIGDKSAIATLLFSMASSQSMVDMHDSALLNFQKAKATFEEIQNEYKIEQCEDEIIWEHHIISSTAKHKPKKMTWDERIHLLFAGGILLVMLTHVFVVLIRLLRR